MTALVQVETIGSVCKVNFNRPEKKNAITLDMYQAVADAINDSVNNEAIKVIVLASGEEHFTSGNDLNDFLSNPSLEQSSSVYQFLEALIFCPLPIIASVKGFAIGVGSTMLLHCERVFADETAVFSMPFSKLGLVPEAASSLLLPKQVGYQQAAHILLQGDSFDAKEALAIGMVSELVDDIDKASLQYAERLTEKPRATLIKIKKLLRQNDEGIRSRFEEELIIFTESLNSSDAKEAMSAFFDKK